MTEKNSKQAGLTVGKLTLALHMAHSWMNIMIRVTDSKGVVKDYPLVPDEGKPGTAHLFLSPFNLSGEPEEKTAGSCDRGYFDPPCSTCTDVCDQKATEEKPEPFVIEVDEKELCKSCPLASETMYEKLSFCCDVYQKIDTGTRGSACPLYYREVIIKRNVTEPKKAYPNLKIVGSKGEDYTVSITEDGKITVGSCSYTADEWQQEYKGFLEDERFTHGQAFEYEKYINIAIKTIEDCK